MIKYPFLFRSWFKFKHSFVESSIFCRIVLVSTEFSANLACCHPPSAEEKSEPPHCVGSAPVKLLNRGLLCVVESDTKRALQPKWYPIKSLRKMEKLHPKHKTTPRRASNFFFFQTWQLALWKSWLYPLVFQSMGRIGTLTSSRVASNQRDIHFQYEIKLINKQIGQPFFFRNLGHRAPTMAEPTFLLRKKNPPFFPWKGLAGNRQIHIETVLQCRKFISFNGWAITNRKKLRVCFGTMMIVN